MQTRQWSTQERNLSNFQIWDYNRYWEIADWEEGPEISQMTNYNQTISSLLSTIQFRMREGWVTHTVSILRGWEKRHRGGHDLEGEKPLDASHGHSPGMVALVPRRAHRALRYLHHAGIRLALSKFGCMPRVRASGGLTAPVETQEGTLEQQWLPSKSPQGGSGAQRPQT